MGGCYLVSIVAQLFKHLSVGDDRKWARVSKSLPKKLVQCQRMVAIIGIVQMQEAGKQ